MIIKHQLNIKCIKKQYQIVELLTGKKATEETNDKAAEGDEKGKEKVKEEPSKPQYKESIAGVKAELRKENEKQFAQLRAQLKAMQADIDSVKLQLAAKDQELAALKQQQVQPLQPLQPLPAQPQVSPQTKES